MKIMYTSPGITENPWFVQAAEACKSLGPVPEIIQVASDQLDANEKKCADLVKTQLPRCDLLVIGYHGSIRHFKRFEQLIAVAKEHAIPIFVGSTLPEEMKEFRSLFPFSDEDYGFIQACIELGGMENTKNLVLWACKVIGGAQIEVPPIWYPPTEGFYHPSLPGVWDLTSHKARIEPSRPTIGILIHQTTYIRENLIAVDALVAAIESQGMNALPFFLITQPNPVTGAIGIRKFIENNLITDGTPIIDVLILNMMLSQLTLSDPNDGTRTEPVYNFFIDLGVPLLQTITMHRTYDAWSHDASGLTSLEISSGVILPEFDGQIITIPLASTGEYEGQTNRALPIPGRPGRVAAMARRWAELGRTPVQDRKVAILLYQYTGDIDGLGHAAALDAPQSVIGMLHRLREAGYRVDQIPESGDELIKKMIAALTNDTSWMSDVQMKERAAGTVSSALYREWFRKIPEKNQVKIAADWGDAPGELFVSDGELCMPGLINGNVFIGIQPPRGLFEQVESLIHSNDIVMPHHYLAYYRWMKNVFGAQAVIHVGTHGTLEWLPGKGNAMSEECYPDVIFEDMPHIYPYIINDPGEAVQAKRRSWAVILTHMIPAMMRAEGYGELSRLDSILQEYFRAKRGGELQKATEQADEAHAIVVANNLTNDLGLPASVSREQVAENAERIYDYICEVRDVIIKDGLHILGLPPTGDRLLEMIYALSRLENGKVPSLRGSVAKALSLSLSALLVNPSGFNDRFGEMNGTLIDRVDFRTRELIAKMALVSFDRDAVIACVRETFGNGNEALELSARYICTAIVPGIGQTTDELANMVRALDAGYIPPGPSGDPTRGNAHLLPTGRNCYSLDPATIPTPAAWKTGMAMADQMVARYVTEKGEYPQRVGIVVWASDAMRTGGDDIAYILWLMGLRPVWSERGGSLTGIEVVPAKELNRPRIDVTLRISGLFRDTFPDLVSLIDEGVESIATLDEADDVNFLAAHLKQDLLEKLKAGMPEAEARDQALIRIFGDPPGNHGCAVGEVVHASAWSERKNLADVYTTWGAYAYGRKFHGENVPELFREQFGKLDATVKNLVSREFDILDTDDPYIFLGGMNACVKAYGNKDPVSVIGEASDPKNVKTRLLDEEIRFLFRSKVLNPRWMEGLKPHGFRGVQEIMNAIEYTFAWDATSDAVDDWEYQAAAEHFLFTAENRQWIEENNPYALHSMAGRLLEAHERGFWDTDDETIQKLQEMYLETEEYFERTGEEQHV